MLCRLVEPAFRTRVHLWLSRQWQAEYLPRRSVCSQTNALVSRKLPFFRESVNFPERTHRISFVSSNLNLIGKRLVLCGWLQYRRAMGPRLCFLTLREGAHLVQVKAEGDLAEQLLAHPDLHLESVLCVAGSLRKRPIESQNSGMTTGDCELELEQFWLLNPCKSRPPFLPDGKVLAVSS